MAEVTFHPEAQAEFQAALVWYAGRSRRAAERFDRAITRVIETLTTTPERYGFYDDVYREAILTRYPYSVVYRIDPDGNVLVVAVAHSAREPGYWQSRE